MQLGSGPVPAEIYRILIQFSREQALALFGVGATQKMSTPVSTVVLKKMNS